MLRRWCLGGCAVLYSLYAVVWGWGDAPDALLREGTTSNLYIRGPAAPPVRCSAGGASHLTTDWSALPPCMSPGTTAFLPVTLHDGLGRVVCHDGPLVLAYLDGGSWRGSAWVSNGRLSIEIPRVAPPGSQGVLRVVLAFSNRTLMRGASDTPGCVYTTLTTRNISVCTGERLSQVSKTWCPSSISSSPGGWHASAFTVPSLSQWEWQPDHCSLVSTQQCLGQGKGPAPPKWIFVWGDEMSQVMVRNIVRDRLGLANPFPGNTNRKRHYTLQEMDVLRSRHLDTRLPGGTRLTYVGNCSPRTHGKPPGGQCVGLRVLEAREHTDMLRHYFTANGTHPDVVVLHSGIANLHITYQLNVSMLLSLASNFASFFVSLFPKGKATPRVIALTTVATAGIGVCARFNAARVMWWDGVRNAALRTALEKTGGTLRVVDFFRLTVPFHWDNDFSDGTTYGVTNARGKPGVQPGDYRRLSHFLKNKRYNPTVGLSLGDILIHAACAADA